MTENMQCPMRKVAPMDLAESVNMDEDFRQFSVIDEVQGDGSGSEFDGKMNIFLYSVRFLIGFMFLDNENMSSDTDLGDNELEDMLNEGLPDDIKNRKTEQQYDEKFKTVLEGNANCFITCYYSNRLFHFTEKGQNHFEVLPEGWVQVTHNSGIPLYLHTLARVCTVSRPYFLGPGSVRVNPIKSRHLFILTHYSFRRSTRFQ